MKIDLTLQTTSSFQHEFILSVTNITFVTVIETSYPSQSQPLIGSLIKKMR